MSYKILVVDDEIEIVNLLKDCFEAENYMVYTATDGSTALSKIYCNPDIIILDINMPDMNGYELCEKIRGVVSCPIIFLSARVEDKDKIHGLSVGGDDYILKPFSIDELIARVQAHIRREQRVRKILEVKFFGDFRIDYLDKVLWYNNTKINLTKTEFFIVELLSMNPNQIFSKDRIYEKLWGMDAEGDSSILVEHIRRIREKIKKHCETELIETMWGMGYRWIG